MFDNGQGGRLTMTDSKEHAVPEPNPNQRRPSPAEETPLQAAPPVPGAVSLPLHPEQRLGPAPAIPVGGGQAAAGRAPERPLAPAPLPQAPVAPMSREGSARPARVGGERPMASAPAPWAGASTGPITARPEVPLARPGEPRQAGWPPAAAAPSSGYAPPMGVSPPATNPISAPAALYGGPAAAGVLPAGVTGQPYALQQPSQPTPPADPAWHQPPANPPPVPPPSPGSIPPEPPTVRPIAWSPHARSGPVGTAVSSAIDGQLGVPSRKTTSGRSLRRVSRVRSSMFAMAFLCVAAVFLVGMLVILALTLAR